MHINVHTNVVFSALMLLVEGGGRKGIWTVKKLSGGMLVWLCLDQGADLHMAHMMPLPLTNSCSSKSRFYLPHAGSPR